MCLKQIVLPASCSLVTRRVSDDCSSTIARQSVSRLLESGSPADDKRIGCRVTSEARATTKQTPVLKSSRTRGQRMRSHAHASVASSCTCDRVASRATIAAAAVQQRQRQEGGSERRDNCIPRLERRRLASHARHEAGKRVWEQTRVSPVVVVLRVASRTPRLREMTKLFARKVSYARKADAKGEEGSGKCFPRKSVKEPSLFMFQESAFAGGNTHQGRMLV